MKNTGTPTIRPRSLCLLVSALAMHAAAVCSMAETSGDVIEKPFAGVTCIHRTAESPKRINLHLVIIDLAAPGIRFAVTGGIPGASGQTNYETTRNFVTRLGAQVGINGGFFDNGSRSAKLTGRGNPVSLCVSNGEVVSPWSTKKNHNFGVNISEDNVVTFIEPPANAPAGSATTPAVKLYNALAGNVRLIRDGKLNVRPGGNGTYPQTAIGLTPEKKLLLLVCDGRQPERSVGMTYEETARVLLEFGAVNAIALDGGGSATLVLADAADGRARVLNKPSDGEERRVGNNLAVFANPIR